jgi:acylphosphatase
MIDQEDKNQRLHARIEGYVQGVGFRAFVQQVANNLGLTGWVRNRWDGAVEVAAEGSRTALDDLIAALKRGPRSSNVTNITISWHSATDEYIGFSVRRTD